MVSLSLNYSKLLGPFPNMEQHCVHHDTDVKCKYGVDLRQEVDEPRNVLVAFFKDAADLRVSSILRTGGGAG